MRMNPNSGSVDNPDVQEQKNRHIGFLDWQLRLLRLEAASCCRFAAYTAKASRLGGGGRHGQWLRADPNY
jgi:hypothetical protein